MGNLIAALDGPAPIDNDSGFHLGGEYIYNGIEKFPIVCRFGYKTTTIANLDARSGLSCGIGIHYWWLDFDYTWVPYGDLGHTHHLGLEMKW